MRRIIWAVVIAALAWSGWWALAAQGLSGGITAWLDARRTAGWQAEAAEVSTSGYPLRLDTLVRDLALADPATGVAVEIERLAFSSPAWWPGDVTMTLPSEAVRLSSPTGRATLTASAAAADLKLHPGRALELEAMSLVSGPWGIVRPEGDLVSAQDVTLRMVQQESDPALYDIRAEAAEFTPGQLAREAWFIPDDWPIAFDSFVLQMRVAFDRPWDRSALEQSRPQPRQIDLELAEAAWGEVRLRMAAALTVDAEGTPSGTVNLQARNWREILTLAQTAGILPPDLRPQIESVLAALAGSDGNPEAFDITLSLSNGWVSVGFLPIGPAPRIFLR